MHIKKCLMQICKIKFFKNQSTEKIHTLKECGFLRVQFAEAFILYDARLRCCFPNHKAAVAQLQVRASSCRSYLTTWARVPKDPGPTAPSIREHPQTPEWGGHTYMCQHGLLITRKTTKCTARITKEQQKVFRLFSEGGSLQILWILYKSHGVAESVVSRYYYTTSCLFFGCTRGRVCLTLKMHIGNHVSHSSFGGQMPKLVIFLTDKNKTAPNSSLGTETSLENPEHTANTYAFWKRSKALENATPLLLLPQQDSIPGRRHRCPALRWCPVGSNHICHEQTCSPQGIYTAWLVSGGQGCHWPLTRRVTLNGFTAF